MLFEVVVLSLIVNKAQARIAREEILNEGLLRSGWHDWRIVLITLVEVGNLTYCG